MRSSESVEPGDMPSVIQTFPNVSFFVASFARKFAPITQNLQPRNLGNSCDFATPQLRTPPPPREFAERNEGSSVMAQISGAVALAHQDQITTDSARLQGIVRVLFDMRIGLCGWPGKRADSVHGRREQGGRPSFSFPQRFRTSSTDHPPNASQRVADPRSIAIPARRPQERPMGE
jgi:hypothetical protein